MSNIPTVAVLLGVVLSALAAIEGARRARAGSKRPPLPPGPTPIPIFGNVIGINKGAPYVTYAEWADAYGDLLYMRILNQEIIILNSEKLAIDLLEKRSQKYSDRPEFPTADMFGWDWATTFMRYGPRFRLHRRLFQQVFRGGAALSYRPKQLQKAYEMLIHILQDPEDYAKHFDKFATSVVMSVTYGYDNDQGDVIASKMKHSADQFLLFATPEASVAFGAFSFLKKLPAWFPFMGFKTEAVRCAKLTVEGRNEPYVWVKQNADKETVRSSMVADAIMRHHTYDASEDSMLVQVIKEAAATVYSAAGETTNSTLLVFVYVMMLHPEVQARAQADIDHVVGTQRLPNFNDRPALPYIDAILRETMRWKPVVPIGVPHATTEEDVYDGYYIPKGATVLANIWAISRNEAKYSNASAFIPERFLQSDGNLTDDTAPWVFGFGRRICPGRHVADASLWAAVVCILMLFKIEKTEGSEQVEWSTGLTLHPRPFPCKFTLRREDMNGDKLAALVQEHARFDD